MLRDYKCAIQKKKTAECESGSSIRAAPSSCNASWFHGTKVKTEIIVDGLASLGKQKPDAN